MDREQSEVVKWCVCILVGIVVCSGCVAAVHSAGQGAMDGWLWGVLVGICAVLGGLAACGLYWLVWGNPPPSDFEEDPDSAAFWQAEAKRRQE